MNDKHDDFEKIYHETFLTLSKYLLFRVAQVSDMEDLLQNVYADLYRKVLLKNKVVDDMNAYLTQMANNELKRYYRWKKKAPLTLIDDEESSWVADIPDTSDSDLLAIERATSQWVEDALQRLELPLQQILIAKIKLDLTFAQIAQSMGINENTVKARYYRALSRIRKEMEE
jgi:RNA polymerase sigma factor (sigma-70 family)